MELIPKIGLEIHAELKTKTKMFCACPNEPDETHPNFNICEICTAQPGTLPTINKAAVEAVIKVGKALNSKIQKTAKFDRKNYFYPDLPKGYQISQYDQPLCLEGEFKFYNGEALKTVRVRRVHLEEDTGKLIHDNQGNSLVDLNRAGVPLMELVTEPDVNAGSEAKNFAKELILILRYLDVSQANMEKGQLRAEANISLAPGKEFGTKVEIKNLNSLRSLEDAINFEITRQKEILEQGGKIIQETRGWDEVKQKTFSQRIKEESEDYRYFPEPDLPGLTIDLSDPKLFKETVIPELPMPKRERFKKEYFLDLKDVDVLINESGAADFFEKAVSEIYAWHEAQERKLSELDKKELVKLTYNFLTSDLFGILKEKSGLLDEVLFTPESFAHLIIKFHEKEISSRMAKDILLLMFQIGQDPELIIKNQGLEQVSKEAEIEKIIKEVLIENEKSVQDYKKGKVEALQFLIGQAMKKTKGKINPEKAKEILLKFLGNF